MHWAFNKISEAMHGALLNRSRILCPLNCLPQVEELVESFPTQGPGPSSSDGLVDSHAQAALKLFTGLIQPVWVQPAVSYSLYVQL